MFTLEHVVPWGRSFDEYCRMFALDDHDLGVSILGCGDGPASFNAEATRRAATVISCDPIYRCEVVQIRERIAASYDQIIEQTRRNVDAFVWDSIASVDDLGRVRMAAMEEFLDDFSRGKTEGRYREAELPTLPFADSSFDLALCSHFLFLYSLQFDEAFHLKSINELCRIAHEVRIFPLVTLDGERSPYVDRSVAELRASGHEATIETVPYEFQRGGNQMVRIRTSR